MKIADVLKLRDVLVGISVPTKRQLIDLLAEKAAASLGVAEEELRDVLHSRENLGSTGIGAGIAIPHASIRSVSTPFILFVRLAKPIEFEAIDDEPVDLVCLVLTPHGEQQLSLTLLSKLSRQLRRPDAAKAIRAAPSSELVHEMLTVASGAD